MTDLENAIHAAAFVRCFYETKHKSDEDRARLAEKEADALIQIRRRALAVVGRAGGP